MSEITENIQNEANYSRIYRHTQDDSTFAIIGSEDKDTQEDRSSELLDLVYKYSRKKHIGFNVVKGTYIYQSGDKEKRVLQEKSLILYDTDKKTALDIAKKINQETILWKDPEFFGVIYTDGSVMAELEKEPEKNMSFLKAEKSDFGFTFEGTVLYPDFYNPVYEKFIFVGKGSVNISPETLDRKNAINIDGVDCMPMTQASLNRIVTGHDNLGYAVISACKSEDDKLKNDIKNKGYSYIEVFGGYREEGQPETFWEKAFLVFPFSRIKKEKADFNKFFSDVIGWIQDNDIGFNQDFALVKFPNENPRYFGKDGKPTNDPEFTGAILYEVIYGYFTSLKDFDKDKPQKFTFTKELYIRKLPGSIAEHHCRTMNGEHTRLRY